MLLVYWLYLEFCNNKLATLHSKQPLHLFLVLFIYLVQFAANECSETSASSIPSDWAVDGARRSHSSWNHRPFSSCESSGKEGEGSTPRCSLSDALPLENSTRGETPSPRKQGASATHTPASALHPWLIKVHYCWWISAELGLWVSNRMRVCTRARVCPSTILMHGDTQAPLSNKSSPSPLSEGNVSVQRWGRLCALNQATSQPLCQ